MAGRRGVRVRVRARDGGNEERKIVAFLLTACFVMIVRQDDAYDSAIPSHLRLPYLSDWLRGGLGAGKG